MIEMNAQIVYTYINNLNFQQFWNINVAHSICSWQFWQPIEAASHQCLYINKMVFTI